MTEIVNYIIGFFLLAGGFLSLVASFGVLRLPDIYTRNHAASKSATLGIMCILLGTFLYFYIVHGIFNSKVLLGHRVHLCHSAGRWSPHRARSLSFRG